uniref:Uncharacterized protein n=1 Tax=Romanomermis culicivorax TaxID=13658 RepID=A0A915K0R5_ROMCU
MKQKYAVVESKLATNNSFIQFFIDSTFNEIYISINGDVIAVQFLAVSTNAALLNAINLIFDSKFYKLYQIMAPYSELVQINITTQTVSYVKVTGVSAISYDFNFLPDPYSPLNVVLDQPIFGSAIFGLIGRNFTYNYTLDSASAVTYDGIFLLNGTVSKYAKQKGYQFLTSQFIPDCRPFNLLVFGLNPCSEMYQIMSKITYRAQEFVIANNLPGTCKANQFDCSFNICIEAGNFRNGRVDCPTGIDEAFPMDEFHCSGLFTFPAYGGTPYWCNRSGIFTCINKICIPYQWVHDGVDDCGDNSDEL